MTRIERADCNSCELNCTYGLAGFSKRPCAICGVEFACASNKISYKMAMGEYVEYDPVCPVCMGRLLRTLIIERCKEKLFNCYPES